MAGLSEIDLTNTPLLGVVLLGILGIVVWNLIPRRFANTRLVVQIGFFLSMSAFLIGAGIIPYEQPVRSDAPDALVVGTAKALWWIHLSWALIGFVRIYIVIEHRPREARLLQELVAGTVYVGMVLSIFAFVFALPIGTLIATSGVLAIVLGLALQNTLGDVFSGIALNLGRSYGPGDWILLDDGTEGRVVETNWRSTHLLDSSNNVMALPNSLLAKVALTNVSSPNEHHGRSIAIRVVATKMPSSILNVMVDALSSCNLIEQAPPPSALITDMDGTSIGIKLSYRVANVERRNPADNEVFDRVYRYARSAGLQLASPLVLQPAMTRTAIDDQAPTGPLSLIGTLPFFAALDDVETKALAAGLSTRTYRDGEFIVRQGEMLPALMIIGSGTVVRLEENAQSENEIERLAPGDVLGGAELLGIRGETATLRATGRVAVHVVDQRSLRSLLAAHPEMMEDLAAALAGRSSTPKEHAVHIPRQHHFPFAVLKAIRRSAASDRHPARNGATAPDDRQRKSRT